MDSIIYLVRHTQTCIAEGICYGQSDVDVSDNFPSEAAIIRDKLKGIDFNAVYSSPLKRCTQLASLLSSDFLTDSRLMEMNFGAWECQSWDHIFTLAEGQAWFADYLHQKCPEGESFDDLLARANRFMADISNTKGNILIVAHAGVIRAIATILEITTAQSAFDLPVSFGQIFKISSLCSLSLV